METLSASQQRRHSSHLPSANASLKSYGRVPMADRSPGQRSCLTSMHASERTLLQQQHLQERGHQSDIANVRRRDDHRLASQTKRRTFTFMGTQATKRRSSVNPATSRRRGGGGGGGRTPTDLRNASIMRSATAAAAAAGAVPGSTHPKRARSGSRTRSTSTSRQSRSRSNVHQTASQKTGLPRATSLDVSQRSATRRNSGGGAAATAAAAVVPAEPNLSLPSAPPLPHASASLPEPGDGKDELVTREQQWPLGLIKLDDRKLGPSPSQSTSTSTSSSTSSNDSDDEDAGRRNVTIEEPRSPSVRGYRKVVYNENEHKWIEHWKMVEDLKRAREKMRRARQMAAKPKQPTTAGTIPHKVKGRSTARMQVMFPTAIVRQDQRHGFALNICMTDPLRLELHKRKAPIVPTYYQEHILKFGKLPFRNNPRPHPVV